MPSPSAASISARNASRVIMVPVGLAGLPTSTPLSGVRRWASRSMSGVIAKRVAAVVSINTASQPSALRMCRYGGYPGTATATRSPGSNIARKARMKPADDPVVAITREGSTAMP